MRHLLRRSAQTAGTGAIQVRCLMCRFGTGGAWKSGVMSTLKLNGGIPRHPVYVVDPGNQATS